nr:hypothetical protein Itr_chr04CG20300 [Ipomoea trifida]
MSSSSVGRNLYPTSSELRGSNTVVDHSNRKRQRARDLMAVTGVRGHSDHFDGLRVETSDLECSPNRISLISLMFDFALSIALLTLLCSEWLSSLLPVFLTPMSSPQFMSLFSRIGVKLVKWLGARFGQGWCNVSNERVTLAACPPIGFGASNPSVKYRDNT